MVRGVLDKTNARGKVERLMRDAVKIANARYSLNHTRQFRCVGRWGEGSVYAGVTPNAIPREYKSSKGGIASKAQNSIVGNNLNEDKNKGKRKRE